LRWIKCGQSNAPYPQEMLDIRLDIVQINQDWGVTDSSGPLRVFPTLAEAMVDAIRRAKDHTYGRATVHKWNAGNSNVIFESVSSDMNH
jgi:hypothetical protein